MPAPKPIVAIVTGGRDYRDRDRVHLELETLQPAVLLEGGAMGADQWAREWGKKKGIECWTCWPCWESHSRHAAGPIRNGHIARMGVRFDHVGTHQVVVLAFPGNRGTANMVQTCESLGLEVRRIIDVSEDR